MSNEYKHNMSRALNMLLNGHTLNRKQFGNASLHSEINKLRTIRFIPIESYKTEGGTCDYSMLPEEIVRYLDVKLRKRQKAEMRWVVERERQEKLMSTMNKLFTRLVRYPALWGVWPDLPLKLDGIAREINALLSHEKSINPNEKI